MGSAWSGLANRQFFSSWALLNDPPPKWSLRQALVVPRGWSAAGTQGPAASARCPLTPEGERIRVQFRIPHNLIHPSPGLGFVMPVGGVAGSIACSPLRYTGEGVNPTIHILQHWITYS